MSRIPDCHTALDGLPNELKGNTRMLADPTSGHNNGSSPYPEINGGHKSSHPPPYGPDHVNGYQPIRNSGTLVQPEELAIVLIVLLLWVAAIALFINRWGKIRLMEPYNPYFEPDSALEVGSIKDDEGSILHPRHPSIFEARASLTVMSPDFGHRRFSNLSNFHGGSITSDRKLNPYPPASRRASTFVPLQRPSYLVPDFIPASRPAGGLAQLAEGLLVPKVSRSRRTSMCTAAEYLLKQSVPSRRSSSLCVSRNSLHVPGSIPKLFFSEPSPTGTKSPLSCTQSNYVKYQPKDQDIEAQAEPPSPGDSPEPTLEVLLECESQPQPAKWSITPRARELGPQSLDEVGPPPCKHAPGVYGKPVSVEPSTTLSDDPAIITSQRTQELVSGSTCSSKQSDV